MNDLVSLTFFPVGGFTKENELQCKPGGADKDCQGDKYQACLMHASPTCERNSCAPAQQLGLSQFLDCFEAGNKSSMASADDCAEAAGFNVSRIRACYNDLNVKASVWQELQGRTGARRPSLTCFPYVELDGEVLTDDCFGPHARTYNLLEVLCNKIKAAGITQPAACSQATTATTSATPESGSGCDSC